MSVNDYSATPANNVSLSGINVGEGMQPGLVNDAIRQLMADLAQMLADGRFEALRVDGNPTLVSTREEPYPVGSLVFARNETDRELRYGNEIDGESIQPCAGSGGNNNSNTGPGKVWKCLGYAAAASVADRARTCTMFERIA